MRQIPKKYQKIYDKRIISRKAAIRSFCIECMGYAEKEVAECPDNGCPLFKWRLRG